MADPPLPAQEPVWVHREEMQPVLRSPQDEC